MEHMDHGMQHGMEGHGHGGHMNHEAMFRQRFWVCLVLSVPVLVFSASVQMFLHFSTPAFPGSSWIVPVFSVVVFVYGGLPFLSMARDELRQGQPGMMTLISLAILVAFGYSLATSIFSLGMDFYWELVTLIDIMLLGHWLEMRSISQASSALEALAKLMPDTAERVLPGGDVETVPASELKTGDLILVRPGASVAADGQVVEGESYVNEAMITGEARPVRKGAGAQVIGGTVNGEGSLRVRVTATGEETALAGIMRLVAEAQSSRSRTQRIADRAAGWLFYIALGSAILTALGWTLATGFNLQVLERVVTVLVIACPHALGLAIPLVVSISTGLAANHGILIRDRLALEEARELDVVVFDKTGTLTKGEFALKDSIVEGRDKTEALSLAASVEHDSEHPIAKALVQAAAEAHQQVQEAREFEAIRGIGAHAKVDGAEVWVGGPNLLREQDLTPSGRLADFAREADDAGQTVVYLAEDHVVTAAFALGDSVRPEATEAVASLKGMGVQVIMLTGDSEAVARSVAKELGIERFFAEVRPEEKAGVIERLQNEGKRVAMVGDGVNDAPALARANVGIAIGSGTDVAIQSAGIILIRDDPRGVVAAMRLARASYRKMIQNLGWAAGYNLITIPLAAGVAVNLGISLSPAAGALLMSLSTIIVAINAQFLRNLKLESANTAAAAG
jgi:Cu2+-exporting ATPase